MTRDIYKLPSNDYVVGEHKFQHKDEIMNVLEEL